MNAIIEIMNVTRNRVPFFRMACHAYPGGLHSLHTLFTDIIWNLSCKYRGIEEPLCRLVLNGFSHSDFEFCTA